MPTQFRLLEKRARARLEVLGVFSRGLRSPGDTTDTLRHATSQARDYLEFHTRFGAFDVGEAADLSARLDAIEALIADTQQHRNCAQLSSDSVA